MNQDMEYITKFSGDSIVTKLKEGPIPVTAIAAVGGLVLGGMIKVAAVTMIPGALIGGTVGYLVMRKTLKK